MSNFDGVENDSSGLFTSRLEGGRSYKNPAEDFLVLFSRTTKPRFGRAFANSAIRSAVQVAKRSNSASAVPIRGSSLQREDRRLTIVEARSLTEVPVACQRARKPSTINDTPSHAVWPRRRRQPCLRKGRRSLGYRSSTVRPEG